MAFIYRGTAGQYGQNVPFETFLEKLKQAKVMSVAVDEPKNHSDVAEMYVGVYVCRCVCMFVEMITCCDHMITCC